MIKKIKIKLVILIVKFTDFLYYLFGFYDNIENLVARDIPEKSDPVAELGMAMIRVNYNSDWGRRVLMLSVSRDIIGLLKKQLSKTKETKELEITTDPSKLRENAEKVFGELMPLFADQGEDTNRDRIRVLEWVVVRMMEN